jgi:dihydroneopterin aldolase
MITGVRASGKHGALEQEKLVAQEFVVDVEIKSDLDEAARTDDLAKTVDYESISVLIHQIVTTTSYNLIETLAAKIADEIMDSSPRIDGVKVTVHKPTAPISVPFGDVAVTIKRER